MSGGVDDLHIAVSTCDAAVVRSALARAQDVNMYDSNVYDSNGRTPCTGRSSPIPRDRRAPAGERVELGQRQTGAVPVDRGAVARSPADPRAQSPPEPRKWSPSSAKRTLKLVRVP